MKSNEQRYQGAERRNLDLEVDSAGKLFFDSRGMVDMEEIEIVNVNVDTVRQLAYGRLNLKKYEDLKRRIEDGEDLYCLDGLENMPARYSGYGNEFHLSKVAKSSGYRIKLQNNALGVTILLGAYHSKLESQAAHIKVELSPHFIIDRTPEEIEFYLASGAYGGRGLLGVFMEVYEMSGVAVHIAADYQGQEMPADFLERFTTRCRAVKVFEGASQIDLSDLATAVTSYGRHDGSKNYLIGRASSLQICLYDKTVEAQGSNKEDFWRRIWGFSSGYVEGETVRRVECRFHHSVIREIGNEVGVEFRSLSDVYPYLTDLWRYALVNNRLDRGYTFDAKVEMVDGETGEISEKRKHLPVIDPLWQILIEDVEVKVPAKAIKMRRKKRETVNGIKKNIDLLIGNIISIAASQGYRTKQVFRMINKLPIYGVIATYYRQAGKNESDLYNYIDKRLALHRLIGKAAEV